MNGNYLLLFFIVVAIVSFVVWRSKQAKRASQSSAARRASDAAQTRSDQAFAIGVATGTMGGSVKDAAVVRATLETSELRSAWKRRFPRIHLIRPNQTMKLTATAVRLGGCNVYITKRCAALADIYKFRCCRMH